MMTLFELAGELPGDVVVVSERDDGQAIFEAAAVGMGDIRTLALGDRIWAETLLASRMRWRPSASLPGRGS